LSRLWFKSNLNNNPQTPLIDSKIRAYGGL
jgi:hypothetical protein